MNTLLVRLIVGLIVPVYLLCVWIPSIIINGLIVAVCIVKKDLHTPVNILSAHISFIGLLMSAVYSTVCTIDFIIAMTSCNCQLTYFTWLTAIAIHLSVYPLNGLILAVTYFCVIRFSLKKFNVKGAIIVLTVTWIISVLGTAPSVYLLPFDVFVTCCEEVCQNNSFLCSVEENKHFVPYALTYGIDTYIKIRDVLFVLVPVVLVAVFTTLSYIEFKKRSNKKSNSIQLERRMLLLPILMSTAFVLLYGGRNVTNRAGIPTPNDSLPGITFYYLITLLDLTSFVCAGLVLFFNVTIRNTCITLVKTTLKKNKVRPLNEKE